MNSKILAIILVAAAVIAGAISAVIVSTKRADIARSKLEIAASKEDAARENRKAKEKEAEAERARLAAKTTEKEMQADKIKLTQAENERLKHERELAEQERLTAETKAKTAADERAKAEALRDSQRLAIKEYELTNRLLSASIRLQELKVRAEEAKAQQEKQKNERELAAVKARELRKLDLDALEQQLAEWKQNLEERERALTPDKTISDLAWAGDGNDSILDDSGNVVKVVKEPYLAEKDRRLSLATRELARLTRLNDLAISNRAATVRKDIIGSLVRLYEKALNSDRPFDAEYYAKSIRLMYPDWKPNLRKENNVGK